MYLVTFKDGVSIELHDNGHFDVVTGSNHDVNLNYHIIMADSQVDFIDNDKHNSIVFDKINRRLGGVLSP